MKELVNITKVKVRFSEVDSMHIVWHGNYVKFLEDGREAFGSQYGLGYYDVYEEGYMTPIVKVDIDYKNQVRYGEELEVKTIFESVDAAKICFRYEISKVSDKLIVAKGKTIQVFLDTEGDLQLTNPPFYTSWKEKWGLI
ncbi:acyl-CoA thioesterase [Plebeiibacterium sediminum]|uniref:Acyl-CoA thioesterase n=1 Tax=Plebeiibacterium sediminum TaxID=2992112 RepID=A0AAE3M1R9_9BACT|nr:acyl-CoA thioesterase [Plebeiobacterium sediminum]MCW3785549.1 acyl-CoA thioesterase [Plebeiobacterium sediminum]